MFSDDAHRDGDEKGFRDGKAKATKREEKLREALRVAESTFCKYERLHRDKLTDAALDKADANRMLANIMEQALQKED